MCNGWNSITGQDEEEEQKVSVDECEIQLPETFETDDDQLENSDSFSDDSTGESKMIKNILCPVSVNFGVWDNC